MQKVQTAEEIILKLRKIEISINQGKGVRMSCREEGISDYTYYKWRREYGSLNVDQARELKKLKEENFRLKKAVADLTLDKLILNEALGIDTVFIDRSQAYLKRIFSLKFELFLRTPKMACNNFLITAQTICFQNFLRDLSFLANSAKDLQQRIAVIAGRYSAFLKIALPNFAMEVLECTEVCQAPDCCTKWKLAIW